MVKIVRVGPDPFGRGELTVFYRDDTVNGGTEVFYLWACHWRKDHPGIPIPPDGFDAEPAEDKPRRYLRACVPYVLTPGHPERLSNLITVVTRK